MKKITDKVEAILEHDPASRSSDLRLLLVFMQKSGLNLTPAQIEVFKNLPSFETITRIRRQLQEQGKYPPTREVEKARFNKYVNVKQDITAESAEEALARQGYRIHYD